MNIIIFDDMKSVAENLKKQISELYPQADIKTTTTITELLNIIQSNLESLVILDIMDADQKPLGIKLASKIHEHYSQIPVILYSGYPRDLFDVYDAPHIYFLEKPFQKIKVQKAIMKSLEYLSRNIFEYRFGSRIFRIPFDLIYSFKSDARIVKIIAAPSIVSCIQKELDLPVSDTEDLYFYKKLDDVEKEINYRFVRISKQELINPKYIYEIDHTKIILKTRNGTIFPYYIARSYVKKVLKNELLISKH